MKGINIAEQCHIVNILPPVDITGGKNCDIVDTSGYSHATFIIQIGVSAAAFTKIFLYECDDVTPTTATAIGYDYYAETTAAGDTLGARTAIASTGLTPSAVDTIMYVIDIDASTLTDGYPYLRVSFTNTTNSVIASAVCILSGTRYAQELTPTAIT